jgi:hypothetical protein
MLRFSHTLAIVFALLTSTSFAADGPVHLVEEPPVKVETVAPNVVLVDFGRVAFGNIQLVAPTDAAGKKITVHFGEDFEDGRVNQKPPGSVRYASVDVVLDAKAGQVVAPKADARNIHQPEAVLTPQEFGVLIPFRWVEIESWPGELRAENIRRRAAFASSWDDAAASFESSDSMLNRIWDLCRYSIKATTFAGVYVDGDRERIAYEGDAYLNQLSHYYAEGDIEMARATFDRLMKFPTWPTEWASHMIFIAHADWMQTGDTTWLAPRYEALKKKLHLEKAREDGLIVTPEKKLKDDLVDWPVGERDGFVFTPVNTVVNAFHIRALSYMADLAKALGKSTDAADYTRRETTALSSFTKVLYDEERGLYRDGEGTDHCSLHANLFPLAFGLVPPENRKEITQWLIDRGMACSVYAAQYLLEGLFENNAASAALALMTADNDRSWKHMVDSGTTITWEAWDQRYKPNQDWNHAWGAAPANLLPRFVLGAQPLTPGWTTAIIRPCPGNLKSAEGKIPTPLGPITIRWTNTGTFKLDVTLPGQMKARIHIPAGDSKEIFLNGKSIPAEREGSYRVIDAAVSGKVSIEAGR